MLGFGEKHGNGLDPTTLPIFVHALQSKEAFDLAGKVWENNGRYVMLDNGNRKELLRFVFNDPPCVVWLGRDQGRQDTYELILLWGENGDKKQTVTEVYILTAQSAAPVGDDARVKSLLSAILTSPSIVPVDPNRANAAASGTNTNGGAAVNPTSKQ
jgi:hypothetical protein